MFLKAFIILAALAGNGKLERTAPAAVEKAVSDPEPATITLAEPEEASSSAVLPSRAGEPGSIAPTKPVGWAALPFTGVRVAAGLDANEVVTKVQKFYERTQRLTAKFRQTYTNKTFGTKRISDGMLYIKKPGKMRWDYYPKKRKAGKKTVEKTFVSDGSMLWAVEHDQKQYAKQDLKKNLLPVAITFLYGKGDLRRDFTAALDKTGKYGKKAEYVLRLLPKKPSAQYKTLYLVVDPGNYRVKQSIVVEASGNTNHFRFYEPNTDKPVLDKYFFFNERKFKGKYRLVNIKKNKGAP